VCAFLLSGDEMLYCKYVRVYRRCIRLGGKIMAETCGGGGWLFFRSFVRVVLMHCV